MKKFNEKYLKLMEDVTCATALGPTQAHPAQVGKSGDFYAPGDARNIFSPPGKRKKKLNIARRALPGLEVINMQGKK